MALVDAPVVPAGGLLNVLTGVQPCLSKITEGGARLTRIDPVSPLDGTYLLALPALRLGLQVEVLRVHLAVCARVTGLPAAGVLALAHTHEPDPLPDLRTSSAR